MGSAAAAEALVRRGQGKQQMDAIRAGRRWRRSSIAKQIVELHGGTIAADSDGVGRGARFTIRLPAG